MEDLTPLLHKLAQGREIAGLAAYEEGEMMGTVFAQGAQWVRADFHLHTRADREFKYTGDDNFYNSNYVDWESRYPTCCHHQSQQVRLRGVQSAAQDSAEEYALLPGVELSVNDGANGIHTWSFFRRLVGRGHDHINPSGVHLREKSLPSTSRKTGASLSLLKPSRSWKAITATFSLSLPMSKHRAGCGRNWMGDVLPSWARTNSSAAARWLPEGPDVQQAAREEQTLSDQSAAASRGLVPAELEGRDAKCIEDIGQGKACYLKLGELSFEAVKFALSDPASRVATEPPSIRRRLSAVFTSTVASSTGKRCISRPN
jgi:hypothetical protein